MTGTSRAGTGVRRRLTHDQTRALLLEHGADVLLANGLAFGMERVSLEDAVRETGVSRTSAYRIWSSDDHRSPQEAYKRDVLLHSIRTPTADDLQSLSDLRDTIISSIHASDAGERNLEAAAAAVADVLMEHVVERRAVILFRSLQTEFATQPDAALDPELVVALDTTETLWRQAVVDVVLAPTLDAFQLVPRYDVPRTVALGQASVAISAFLAGVLPKASLPSAAAIIDEPLSRDSELKLGNVCLGALLMTFFQLADA